MDDSTTEINSCLMLAVGLYTPVDIESIFNSGDLKDTGVELDSHITLLYAQGKTIPREHLLEDIQIILGNEYDEFIEECKTENFKDVFSLFELGIFENDDSDYLVLKLKDNIDIFNKLSLINKGLSIKYKVKSDFDNYVPHITLAELIPGTAKKYKNSKILNRILEDTKIDLEDLMISYGTSSEIKDRKQYFLTHYKNVDRYFRINGLNELRSECRDSEISDL